MNISDYDFKKAKAAKETFINTIHYQEIYGPKTIVLTQIGSFYEVYGIQHTGIQRDFENDIECVIDDDDNDDNIIDTQYTEYRQICNLNVAEKKMVVTHIPTNTICKVLMSGFGMIQIDKYISILQKHGYIVVRIDQESMGVKNPKRHVQGIYSPGCKVISSLEDEVTTNNIVCIWIESTLKQICIGISSIDTYTGKCSMYQYTTDNLHSPITYDDLERYISIIRPNEFIIISKMNSTTIDEIIGFIGIQQSNNISVHRVDLRKCKKVKNCEKQTYQKELLSKFYKFDDFSIFNQNFYHHIIATQSFCYLLDFIFEHNPDLIRNIEFPIFENLQQRLILYNHSLKQLNIIDDGVHTGKYSSICKMLNECVTPLGKRHFEFTLLHPIIDPIILNREYDIIEYIMSMNIAHHNFIQLSLKKMGDLQKIIRGILIKRMTPKMVYILYKFLTTSILIDNSLKNDTIVQQYLLENNTLNSSEEVKEIISYLENTFYLERGRYYNYFINFNKIVIRPGISTELDELMKNELESMDKINSCIIFLNRIIDSKNDKTVDYIKLHETDKFGLNLVCTVTRSKLLIDALKKFKDSEEINSKGAVELDYISSFDSEIKKFIFVFEDLQLLRRTNTENYIDCKFIQNLCTIGKKSKIDFNEEHNKTYNNCIANLEKFYQSLNRVYKYITSIDMIYCKALIAIKYHYCKPQIQENSTSFFRVEKIRHPIIECIQNNEFYIPNDLYLNSQSMILYGTNSVGKTSFIRSVGISIILAQSGFYVPASSFIYCPYENLFTRILNNDNLFESLSTFIVEMLELKTILQFSKSRSIILGDELCSGTESISGRSIVVAGLESIKDSKSTAIFTTHLHELMDYSEIKDMIKDDKLIVKHMSVIYNRAKNLLIYNRTLKDGNGPNIYGLEVLKKLGFPIKFLERADYLRIKYFPLSGSVLEKETSIYSSEKIRGICEECNLEMSTETHHIYHQKNADVNGFITTIDGRVFHKNHPKNLKCVCEKCHKKFHAKDNDDVEDETSVLSVPSFSTI